MNRIEKKLSALRRSGTKAFVAFITAGDPSLATTERLMSRLEGAGVDILELGVPFSDPMADGPVVQRSSERALAAGTSLHKVVALVKKFRRRSELPILLMGYFNPIHAYGVEQYFRDAAAAGIDGTLIVDLPPDEGEPVRQAAKANGVSLIYLLAPTSDPDRIHLVERKGSGFIYYVSLTGITGAKLSQDLKKHRALRAIRKNKRLPVCVGFGIREPAQAKRVAALADGVVVGSALVQKLETEGPRKGVAAVAHMAERFARAIHGKSEKK